MIFYLDANIVLRLLLGTPEDQSRQAAELFAQASQGRYKLVVHPAVLAEVIYVLLSPRQAGKERADIASALRQLAALPGVEIGDLKQTLAGLSLFESTDLDWVDCLLLGCGQAGQVVSFDTEMVGLGARNPAEITAED